MEAYVPTQQELSGDFSTFGVTLLDPHPPVGSILSSGQFVMESIPGQHDRPLHLRITACSLGASLPVSFSATLSVPIVLSLAGANNSFYTLRVDSGEPGEPPISSWSSVTRRPLEKGVAK